MHRNNLPLPALSNYNYQKMNKKLLSAFVFMLIGCSLSAQYGIRVKYASQSGEVLDFSKTILETQDDIYSNSIELGLDYWLKPFEKRIEFIPELAYSFSNYESDKVALDQSAFSFILNTRAYPMDLGSDCDCPTFSKEGSFVTKGFYFELSPGIMYNTQSLETSSWPMDREAFSSSISDLAFRLGIGAGLDIGISNLLTINPFITYNIISSNNPTPLLGEADPRVDLTNVEGDISQLVFGIRLSFRPNYDPFRR